MRRARLPFIIGIVLPAIAVVAFVVCSELFGTAWWDWGGWKWVFLPIYVAIGFYFGWDARGTREKHRRWRDEALAHDVELTARARDVGP